MAKSGRVAIVELVSRGKEQLVLIRPYRKGLVLHTMYHADEVREFTQVPKGEKVKVSETEVELGVGLIERLTSEEFHPEDYKDEYRIRVLAMLDEKSKGKEVTIKVPSPQRDGKVVDIMEALKAQHGKNPSQKETGHDRDDKEEKKCVLKVWWPNDSNPFRSPPLMRTGVPLSWRLKHSSGTITWRNGGSLGLGRGTRLIKLWNACRNIAVYVFTRF
jgi:Ku70/Ku80 beta-barrel domain